MADFNPNHELKIISNQLEKMCKTAGIPMFFTWYDGKDWVDSAVLPKEIGADHLQGHMNGLIRSSKEFHREDYQKEYVSSETDQGEVD